MKAALAMALTPALLALLPAAGTGGEVELFVTDYTENPSPTQRALVERPARFAAAEEVIVRRADGNTATFRRTGKVVVYPSASPAERRTARIFAAPGEYEPFSFTLRPRRALRDVFLTAGALRGPGGATIGPEHIALASVERFHGGGRDVLVGLGRKWNMDAHAAEFFWCTVHVPTDAVAGVYRGTVTATAGARPLGTIDVELEVLPVRLADVPYSMGLNYSRPKDPAALAVHLADMRAHGMTSVGPLYNFPLPVHDADTSALGAFLRAYRKAGFPGVCYFATPMNLQVSVLSGYGTVDSRRWQQKYIQVMRRLHAETKRHDVPVVMSIADELTNKGIEGVRLAGRLARFAWEELPEIATASDMNGYREVLAMAPWLNVAAFNNGWDGIDHHNGGRHLVNRAFIEQVRRTGAIPWFVNTGTGRFPFGLFFWKMARLGVRGKIEWYYNLDNRRGCLVRTDGTKVFPTLDYERCREGIDDLKYLCALEALCARARQTGRAEALRRAAEQLLRRLDEAIEDDWSAYASAGRTFPPDGMDLLDRDRAAALGDLNAIRRAVADRLVALQAALK